MMKRSWNEVRLAILARDSFVCSYCLDDATEVDHIVPRARGGTDAGYNLLAVCKPCNCSKGMLTAWEWFEREKFPAPPWFLEKIQAYSNDR